MAMFEQRVSRLEARVEEHSNDFAEIKGLIVGLENKMERRFDAMERRFEGMERRFEGMEQRFDRRFLWLIGFQFSTLLAVIAAAIGALTKLL